MKIAAPQKSELAVTCGWGYCSENMS